MDRQCGSRKVIILEPHSRPTLFIQFGLSEKHTKFEKIFHLNLTLLSSTITQWRQIEEKIFIFFQILCGSQKIQTLTHLIHDQPRFPDL